MGITLGGKNERFHRIHGDIVASYAYVNGERAMILYPLHRRLGVTPFIVCDSAAWKYDDAEYLAQQARLACRLFGDTDGVSNWFRIAKVIHDGLQDLIRLKPEPDNADFKTRGEPIGTAQLREDGRVVAEGEVDGVTEQELDRYIKAHGALVPDPSPTKH